jgi:hypothetical protein
MEIGLLLVSKARSVWRLYRRNSIEFPKSLNPLCQPNRAKWSDHSKDGGLFTTTLPIGQAFCFN